VGQKITNNNDPDFSEEKEVAVGDGTVRVVE